MAVMTTDPAPAAAPVNWNTLSARLSTALEVIMITADAAAQTWTGAGDAAVLRARLAEIRDQARTAVSLHDQTVAAR